MTSPALPRGSPPLCRLCRLAALRPGAAEPAINRPVGGKMLTETRELGVHEQKYGTRNIKKLYKDYIKTIYVYLYILLILVVRSMRSTSAAMVIQEVFDLKISCL